MKVGLHIADFTWDGGPPELGPRLGEIARRAEEAGVDRVSVMDHVWQIGGIGPPEDPMLEAYTTLGYLAGVTRQVRLHALVTAVVDTSLGPVRSFAASPPTRPDVEYRSPTSPRATAPRITASARPNASRISDTGRP